MARKKRLVCWKGLLLGCWLLVLYGGQGYSQNVTAPYLGGDGDGYAKAATTSRVPGDPVEDADSVVVFPNRLRRGMTAHVTAVGLENKVEVRVHDMAGNLVWHFRQWNLTGDHLFDLPTSGLAAGTYLVEVRRDGKVETEKMVVTEE